MHEVGPNYRRYIEPLARRWYLLLLCSLIGTGLMAYKASHTPKIYQASSKIAVVPNMAKARDTSVQAVEELNYFYDSQVALVSSPEVLARVEAVMKTRRANPKAPYVQTSARRDRDNLKITVRSTDANYARAYASAWASTVLDLKEQEKRDPAIEQRTKATRDELARNTKRVEKAREALARFEREHQSPDPKEVAEALQREHEQRHEELDKVVSVRQQLEKTRTEDLVKAAPATVKSKLQQKVGERAGFYATLKAAHPLMVKINNEVTYLESELRSELQQMESNRLARVQTLRGEEEALKQALADLQQRLSVATQVQAEFSKLQEEETRAKAVLAQLNYELHEIKSKRPAEPRFAILEAGIGRTKPIEPNWTKMLLIGSFAGFAVGLGLVQFLDRLAGRLELAKHTSKRRSASKDEDKRRWIEQFTE
jgi:uncharacterized protein involved in exopolysaccharide biosynthesis